MTVIRIKYYLLAAALIPFLFSTAVAQDDVIGLSLEQLMDMEVFSVSKKKESLSATAAAMFVINEEDIRRSTANTIPDLLRMVPGLNVAQVSANKWAITSRGFNSPFANKLLVLVDGRTVYNPLFGGTYWNSVDLPLSSISRIEVIRGPGGTIWGANAVNGVINIITKSALDTNSSEVTAGSGSEELVNSSFTGVTALGETGKIRFYGKGYNRDSSKNIGTGDDDAYDASAAFHGGLRSDWDLNDSDSLTVTMDMNTGQEEIETQSPDFIPPDFEGTTRERNTVVGASTLARWERRIDAESQLSLQGFVTYNQRQEPLTDQRVNVYDFELQHSFVPFEGVETTWGAGYRATYDKVTDGLVSGVPEDRTVHLVNGFVQASTYLVPDELKLTVGSKVEHNDFSGIEVQPGAQMVWTPNETHSVWASFSRAVRTPTRADQDIADAPINISMPPGSPLPVFSALSGGDTESEVLNAYEIGYRVQPCSKIHIDVTAFYFDYDHFSSLTPGTPTPDLLSMPPRLVVPLIATNNSEANTYGGEIILTGQPLDSWKLQAVYSLFKDDITLTPGDQGSTSADGASPENQVGLRSMLDLPLDLEFDAFFRFVDRLANDGIDAYSELDLRLGWNMNEDVSFSIIGKNLLHGEHQEFDEGALGSLSTELERSFFGRVTVQF